MIANPPAGEWLTWRRSYNATGFSPLKQITKGNVGELRLAWSWTLASGPNENTPLVHDGVIFCHGLATKCRPWTPQPEICCGNTRGVARRPAAGHQAGLAIYGNKLYFSTSDMHMVALDVKTGRVVWDQEIAEKNSRHGRRRFRRAPGG